MRNSKEYPIIGVETTIDPVSKETCGGDHYIIKTSKTKRNAFATAKQLKKEYEIHVYEESNGNVSGHWIFRQGNVIENMFNN